MTIPDTEQLRSSQKSVHFPREEVAEADRKARDKSHRYMELYPHMLIEDISLRIMPTGGRTNNKNFRVEWASEDTDVEAVIVQSISHHHRWGLAEAACEFFHDCAQTMMIYGIAVYEIVMFSSQDTGEAINFRLVQINPDSLAITADSVIQNIPKSVAERHKINTEVSIPRDLTQIFLVPESIRNKFDVVMDKLSMLSSPGPTELMFPENTSTQSIPYDYSKHMRLRAIAILDAVKEIGWNARRMPEEDDVLEYYWLERRLRFEEFLIDIRSCILAGLNEAVMKAGREIGFAGVIEIEGLPSLEDVEESRRRLSVGEGRFDEMLEPFTRV